MIDDSIVRGTTSNLIVDMLREAGAKEVHMRISAPPFLYPCYFGTDIPSSEQLIAHNRTVDEICKVIGADSLAYLKMERLSEMAKDFRSVRPASPESIRWIRRKKTSAEVMKNNQGNSTFHKAPQLRRIRENILN